MKTLTSIKLERLEKMFRKTENQTVAEFSLKSSWKSIIDEHILD